MTMSSQLLDSADHSGLGLRFFIFRSISCDSDESAGIGPHFESQMTNIAQASMATKLESELISS